jgi:eukaryotic-like serine/threonine-protein kinase
MPVEAGTRFAQYEIRSLLGRGGMGEVYLAQDTRLNRLVALKLLPVDLTSDADRLRRFEQEACAASSLNHPNIITIHEIEQTGDGGHFIITEFIDGETLRQRLMRGRMPVGEILDVAEQVACALGAAHEAGIIHRDIKPENIMIRRDRYVKVLDFGLAKLLEKVGNRGGDSGAAAQTLLVTDPNVVMGTVAYMSPEQARGQKVDERTDIWSLGCVLYEMAAGLLPFGGSTLSAVLAAVLEKEPAELAEVAPHVPPEFERIVKKSLSKKREERYGSVQELQADLQSLKRTLGVDAEIDRSVEPTIRINAEASQDDLRKRRTGETPVGTNEFPGARLTVVADEAAGAKRPGRRLRHVVAGASALLAITALVLGVVAYRYFTRDASQTIRSIAILPFANDGNDPNSEYLADGITEGIINDLSQLQGLTVIARSSVFRYKGQEVDPQKVASELGVEAVLTGRVIGRGDSLQISAELVDARNNKHLWGEQYLRKLSDIFSLQGDIVREISSKLRLKLSGEDGQRMMRRRAVSPEAYELYLKGRFYWNKRTQEDLKKGIDFFNQAIALDPNYAQAYAGLADCYALGGLSLPQNEALPRARAAAMKALELDDGVAEAHTSLGFVYYRLDWDWASAEREYRRAIELNPSYATAHHWYGVYLLAMGRLEEAMTEARRAQQLDPLSPTNSVEVGRVLYFNRQYEQAIEHLKKSLEMDKNFVSTHIRLGQAYVQKGMSREAVMHLRKAAEVSGDSPEAVAALAQAYAASDNQRDAQKQLDKLKEMAKRRNVASYDIATVYAGLGDKEKAFAWLETSVRDRSVSLIGIKLEPMLDGLRSDPRFADLLKRIGLQP